MGSTLVRILAMVLIASAIVGCGGISADTVRDKDQQREDVSKNMPGNDVPPDPADGR